MNLEQIRTFCSILGVKVHASRRTGWAEIPCPLAFDRHLKGKDKNPSFGIQITKPGRISKAHCFSCSWSGAPGDLVEELRHLLGKNYGIDFKTAYELAHEDDAGGVLELAY